jgi:hypothetical protein
MEESIVPKNKKHVKAKGGAPPPSFPPKVIKILLPLDYGKRWYDLE